MIGARDEVHPVALLFFCGSVGACGLLAHLLLEQNSTHTQQAGVSV